MPRPKSLAVDVLLLFTIVIHTIFLLTSTHAQVIHASRTHLRRRHPKAPGKASSNYTPTYNWEQKQYVEAHNNLREKGNVPPLQWHPDLANSSQAWANELRHTCDYRSHSKGNKYGENIYWSLYKEFTPKDVVEKWHSENVHFDHVTNLCQCHPETDKCECGHYLNVIWKNTQWVGCSNAVYCTEAKGVIVVCQYDPIGNYKGVNPLKPLAAIVSEALLLPKHLFNAATGHHDSTHTTPSSGHHAATGTSSQHTTSINIGVSHAQHTSIDSDDTTPARETTSIDDNDNDDGYAQDPTSIKSDSYAPHVPPSSTTNSGGDPTTSSINSDSSVAYVPPSSPMQSMTTTSNDPPPTVGS